MTSTGPPARPSHGPPVTKNGHPPWYPPLPSPAPPLLRMNNSLTGESEVFVPGDNRRVLWYTCGPTVYDVSHLGHARAYLTFDILRRLMEDYFGLDVLYQINTTDVDDKIILRARRGALLARYRDDPGTTLTKALDDARCAIEDEIAASNVRREELESEAAGAAKSSGRDRRDAEEAMKVHALKHSNLERMRSELEGRAARRPAADGDASDDDDAALLDDVLDIARDPLGAYLDTPQNLEGMDINAVCSDHARRYERAFMDDMDALGVRRPDVLTRVTEYIPKIVDFIGEILGRGLAYVSNGSVYLDLAAYRDAGHDYRKLKPAGGADTTAAEMSEGEGSLLSSADEKRGPNDFALWKASKPGEPVWDSPWGLGRPGWHIECSVVASDILGPSVDIHAGGDDLKFPHHDNEIAQTEARYGPDDCRQWVNFFLHAGHLHIEGLKMSKSLKNFITIREALAKHTARQLRLLFLFQRWDQPMTYSDQTLGHAKIKEGALRSFFNQVKDLTRRDYLGGPVGWNSGEDGEHDRSLADRTLTVQNEVHLALCDNFDTPRAAEALFELISAFNVYVRRDGGANACPLLAARVARYVTRMLRILGLTDDADSIGMDLRSDGGGAGAGIGAGGAGAGAGAGADLETTLQPYLDALVNFREEVRSLAFAHKGEDMSRELLSRCDELRDGALAEVGVALEDRPGQAAMWRLSTPDQLRREAEERRERAREGAVRGAEARIARLKKDADAAREFIARTSPFGEGEFGSYHPETGLPTTTADGEPIGKGQLKKATKKLAAFNRKRDDFKKKVPGGDVGAHLARVEEELKEAEGALEGLLRET